MYIDAIVLFVLLIIVITIFRRFDSFVYSVAIIDIFLRILTFIKNNIPLKDISNVIGKYLPESIMGIIDRYSDGIVQTILSWIYVAIMAIFLYYIIKLFVKKKKI